MLCEKCENCCWWNQRTEKCADDHQSEIKEGETVCIYYKRRKEFIYDVAFPKSMRDDY